MYKGVLKNLRYQLATVSAIAMSFVPLAGAHAVNQQFIIQFQKIANYVAAGGPPPPSAPVFDANTSPIMRSLLTLRYNQAMDEYIAIVTAYDDSGDPSLLNPILPNMPAGPAAAGPLDPAQGHSFNDIGRNITDSLEVVPGLLSGTSYMLALMMGATAILKIKSHVQDPLQTPIREGALRLMAGGALLAMPIVYEAMFTTVGDTATVVTSAPVSAVAFNTTP